MGMTTKPRKVEIERIYGLEIRFQIIKPRGGGAHQKHFVFDSRQQFELYFMTKDGVIPKLVTNWRVSNEGDWVLADDGGICQIIKRGDLKHGKDTAKKKVSPNGYRRTVVGTFNSSKHYGMDTDFTKHVSRYTFTNNPQAYSYMHQMKNRDYLTKKERKFVANLMMFLQQGNGRQESMIMAVKEAGYNARDIHSTLEKANLLIQQDRIMKLISEQMTDAAEELGITVKAVMKDVWEMGHGDENGEGKARREDVRLSALKQSGVYAGMEKPELNDQAQIDSGYSGFEPAKIVDGKDTPNLGADALEAEFAQIQNGDEQ
jgi:hypothetical protein